LHSYSKTHVPLSVWMILILEYSCINMDDVSFPDITMVGLNQLRNGRNFEIALRCQTSWWWWIWHDECVVDCANARTVWKMRSGKPGNNIPYLSRMDVYTQTRRWVCMRWHASCWRWDAGAWLCWCQARHVVHSTWVPLPLETTEF
jgi:hypothetical protein